MGTFTISRPQKATLHLKEPLKEPGLWNVIAFPRKVCVSSANKVTAQVFNKTFSKKEWEADSLVMGSFSKDIAETKADYAERCAFSLMVFCPCASVLNFICVQA